MVDEDGEKKDEVSDVVDVAWVLLGIAAATVLVSKYLQYLRAEMGPEDEGH